MRMSAGVVLTLKVLDEAQNLCLYCYVERCSRLIRNKQTRLANQRHCDHHPLTHTAGKLMRIIAQALLGVRETDATKHFNGTYMSGMS